MCRSPVSSLRKWFDNDFDFQVSGQVVTLWQDGDQRKEGDEKDDIFILYIQSHLKTLHL